MLNYDNTNIFTGYLKQLLASVPLPTYKIYSQENVKYLLTNEYKDGTEKVERQIVPSNKYQTALYFKDNVYQKYMTTVTKINNTEKYSYKWETVTYGLKENKNNYNRYLITNNIYDSYTHNVLGNYLRYLRDAKNTDLMCLYNCFSNEMPINMNLELGNIKFNTEDYNYKIYMLPVKFLKKYTIAIDCPTKVEMFCGFYNTSLIMGNDTAEADSEITTFIKNTYISYNNLRFNTPELYDKLLSDTIYTQLSKEIPYETWKHSNFINLEEDLKLFIKLPATNNSGITILEGDYINWNDRQYRLNTITPESETSEKKSAANWNTISNKFIVNFDGYQEKLLNNTEIFKPITYLQLLQINTQVSHPFADRLIEYLLGNAITNDDELEDNIKRIQTVMSDNSIRTKPIEYGLWSELIKPVLYTYMQKHITTGRLNHDLLGYVDKDVEDNYRSIDKNGNTISSLKDVDLYKELYIDSKVTSREQR